MSPVETEAAIDSVHLYRGKVASSCPSTGSMAIADHDDPDGVTYATATSYMDAREVRAMALYCSECACS